MNSSTIRPGRRPTDAHTYTPTTTTKLYMVSGGLCMNPDCRALLMVHKDKQKPISGDNVFLSKNIAHIHSDSPSGPRYESARSIDDLRGYSNLLVLCPTCHTMIDALPDDYPASVLETWRTIREDEALRRVVSNLSLLATVVRAVTLESAFQEPVASADSLVPFQIADKITFNKLSEGGLLVREYSVYEGALRQLYAELEQQSPFKKASLLSYVEGQYQKAKNHYLAADAPGLPGMEIIRAHSDDIFHRVHESLIETVKRSGTGLSYEETWFGTLIVMVDAFIVCRVLEAPK